MNDPDRLRNDEWHEFASRAKRAGQDPPERHVGPRRPARRVSRPRARRRASSTWSSSPSTSARIRPSTSASPAASTSSRRQPELPRVLAKARAKGVGVVAMKTLRGARLNDMRPYEGAGRHLRAGRLRWVLRDRPRRCARRHDEERRRRSTSTSARRAGPRCTRPTRRCLRRYARRTASARSAATAAATARARARRAFRSPTRCARACTPSTTRSRSLARAALAEIGGAAACLTCDGSPCATACPHGVAIPALTKQIGAAAGPTC